MSVLYEMWKWLLVQIPLKALTNFLVNLYKLILTLKSNFFLQDRDNRGRGGRGGGSGRN